MNSIRFVSLRYMLILLVLLALSACVYTRLLEVKNQLANFDEYFRVKVESGHFILDFRKPVLYDSDFTDLTHLNPSRVVTQKEGYQWFLDFSPDRPQNPAGKPPEKIVYCMTFGADHKLRSWDFSPLFLQMAPPAFLEASLRSLGKGKILQSHRQLKVDYKDMPAITEQPPALETITSSLGQPDEIYRKDELDVYLYRFKADSTATDREYQDMRQAEAKLYFDPANGRLAKMSSRFAGLKISIDYRKMTRLASTQD